MVSGFNTSPKDLSKISSGEQGDKQGIHGDDNSRERGLAIEYRQLQKQHTGTDVDYSQRADVQYAANA